MKLSSSVYYFFLVVVLLEWNSVVALLDKAPAKLRSYQSTPGSLKRAFTSFISIRTPMNRTKPKAPSLISIDLEIGSGLGGNPGILGILG